MTEQTDLFPLQVQRHPALSDWRALESLLQRWQERGWIRALDLALGRFLHTLEPEASPLILLAAVLTSHQLGRGHICADIDALLSTPDAALSLPPDGEFGEALPDRPAELLQGVERHEWLGALESSALVGDGDPPTPLVLEPDSTRLYLYRQWRYEVDVAASIGHRLEALPVDESLMRQRLAELFTPADGHLDWQQLACALMAGRRFGIITGGPGTGKTTTVVKLLALLQSLAEAQGEVLRIRLAAPTGKAAARLTESISGAIGRLPAHLQSHIPAEVTTLHRLLGARPDTRRFVHNADNPLHADLVVVDEASMIDLEMMHQLLAALPPRARLVLLGDKDQLASVEAGSVLGDLCEGADQGGYAPETLRQLAQQTGQDVAAWQAAEGEASQRPLSQSIAMLRHSHRFGADSGIGALARAVNAGDPERVQQVFQAGYVDLGLLRLKGENDAALERLVLGDRHVFPAAEGPAPRGYRHYLSLIHEQRPAAQDPSARDDWARQVLAAFAEFQLLCALRRGPWGVEGLNDRIATALASAGLIERTQGWYEGRPVLVTRNDYGLGLMNGDIGITLKVLSEAGAPLLRVVFPLSDGTLKWVLPSRLQSIETVYAMTVHKSQGSEFAHTAMVLPPNQNPVLTRELVYTGITRASRWFSLLLTHPARLEEAVRARVRRASGLRGRLLTG
ncbi:exodeoxyribonuclease V subunit alpha [Marinobacterium sp. AK62]|uniref:RecBCD enzyme subunit RecD n=1 Tax=Marinobacterium alkalitolerans TaxID=1542925 RepID=A0ABS3ZA80_9GAMM|nr:exodeoxyribonuclease V subunit alpha [Marinobacterium alkalitolerans]MBP0048612.1 exodeoxyribonuclease V subunit alpha [Marinobacterium alkalitolerans]